MCWIVGPRHAIDTLSSVGSFMDGGANNALQKAAIPFLDADFVKADALALQSHFRAKRDYMLRELSKLGIKSNKPGSTFYIWADVSNLPPPLNHGVIFFEYLIRHKAIVVPGIFFDVNPGHRRKYASSKYLSHVRMSYGPEWANLKLAIKAMNEIVDLAKNDALPPLDSYAEADGDE